MNNNEFIVYRNRDRVVTDIESLAAQLRILSVIIDPHNNHISNEEFLLVDEEIGDLISNTCKAVNETVGKIKSKRGI